MTCLCSHALLQRMSKTMVAFVYVSVNGNSSAAVPHWECVAASSLVVTRCLNINLANYYRSHGWICSKEGEIERKGQVEEGSDPFDACEEMSHRKYLDWYSDYEEIGPLSNFGNFVWCCWGIRCLMTVIHWSWPGPPPSHSWGRLIPSGWELA